MLAYMKKSSYLCSVIKKEIVKQLKHTTMKTTKITKDQAITIIKNILIEGCDIPMASLGNGGAGFGYVQPDAGENDYDELVSWLKGTKSFRIVPTSEISDEFSDMNLDEYDVCVEFTNNDGDYSEQYLLWDIDYYKD